MTQDLDQSLELICAVIALLFGLLFLMDWLEDSLQQRASVRRKSIWRTLRLHLPPQRSGRSRRR